MHNTVYPLHVDVQCLVVATMQIVPLWDTFSLARVPVCIPSVALLLAPYVRQSSVLGCGSNGTARHAAVVI